MCQTLAEIHLSPDGGYIGKQTLQESGSYLSDCIWSLEVKAGQKISFTVFSFLYGQAEETGPEATSRLQKVCANYEFVEILKCSN